MLKTEIIIIVLVVTFIFGCSGIHKTSDKDNEHCEKYLSQYKILSTKIIRIKENDSFRLLTSEERLSSAKKTRAYLEQSCNIEAKKLDEIIFIYY